MSDVLLIGEGLVDIVIGPDGTPLGEHPGGSPANVAVGLARLGHTATLLTHIADDAHGKLVLDHLGASGVLLAPGSRDAVRTPTATAHLSDEGAARYDFDIAWELPAGVPALLTHPEAVDCVHTGSIAAVMTPGADRVQQLWRLARPRATLSFDPNLRPSIIGEAGAEAARARIEELAATADLIKVSDEDAAWLAPHLDPVEVASRWLDAGTALVVVTRGGQGATALSRAGRLDVAAPEITVVDTVGAGDSFMGGLLDGLSRLRLLGADRRDALLAIDDEEMAEVVAHAVRIAAITCSRPGADPPTRAELALA